MKFIHLADVHLGYKQYGCYSRLVDFAQAFYNAIKFGIDNKVDFILIAGDLFHKKSEMDPVTLMQATKVLKKAKNANIPVIAVEGNHDSTYFRESYSWMDYLARNNLIINLKPRFEDKELIVDEWDGQDGAYVDLGFVRIYGMKYYGSLTPKILEKYYKKIRKKDFTIFMAHIGVEGYLNIYGCIPSSKLHKLKGKVDYVALGHIHKSFVEDDFIFNPGSLEVCEVSEASFKRGIFYVEVDNELKYKLVGGFSTRKFLVLEYEFSDLDYGSFENFITSYKNYRDPVVYLKIKCLKNLKKSLDEEKIRKIIKNKLNPVATRIVWDVKDNIIESTNIDVSSREIIERQVISQILQSFPYGEISDEVLRLKEMFIKSTDLHAVDKFIEKIVENKEISSEEEEYVWDWRKARF